MAVDANFGATPADVRNLVDFPDDTVIDDTAVQSWLDMRTGDLNMLLRLKGAQVPISAPDELVQRLKEAVIYGTAANMAAAYIAGRSPDEAAATIQQYEARYNRIYDSLNALTAGDLLRLGIITTITTDAFVPMGLAMVGNDYADRRLYWQQSIGLTVVGPDDYGVCDHEDVRTG